MATKRKAASKRELIEPNKGDKRYVRREADGRFGKTVDVGKSLSADQRRKASDVQIPLSPIESLTLKPKTAGAADLPSPARRTWV